MLQFLLLGPVEVHADGEPVPLRGPKQRALLALLLLRAGTVVSRDRLAVGLWGDDPPAGVEHALDAQVSALRRTLAAHGGPVVERRPPGYALTVEPEALDVNRFDRLVSDGRALVSVGDVESGAALLRRALGLWRGPALADVQAAPFAADAAAALEQRRLGAVEDQIEADLARGLATELVPELETAVGDHPFRERMVCALATALYRAGQQSRALEVIASARREFAAELGLAPGPAVQDLERRILVHDPELGHPTGHPTSHPVSHPVSHPSSHPTSHPTSRARPTALRRRRAVWAVATAGACLLGGTLVALEISGSVGEPRPRDPPSTSAASTWTGPTLAGVDIEGGRSIAAVPLAGDPSAFAMTPDGIWVAEAAQNVIEVLDPDDGVRIDSIQAAGAPGALAVGDGAVWVACTLSGEVLRVDQETNQVTQVIDVGGAPTALTFGGGRLWVADQNGSRLLAIDPGSGAVTARLSLPGRPTALTADASSVWVASHDAGTVTRVDAASTSQVTSVEVGGGPTALAAGAGSIWVANNQDSTVSRLDPVTARVTATVPVNSGPSALALAGGALWVAGEHAGTLARLDPGRNAVTDATPLGGSPVAVAADGSTVWAGTTPAGEGRGGTLTMLGDRPPSTLDPGFQLYYNPPQLLGLVHDGLVTLTQTSGPRGLQLVPDLAVALPRPTDAATSFTFQLRPSIRYSTGAPVRAGDFRRAFERLFRGSSPGTSYYAGLVGADRCLAQPADCRLDDGVVTNDAAGTVTFRLSTPDPEFLFRLAAMSYAVPVPQGTRWRDRGMRPIPGTGPYRVAHVGADVLRLERNPRFEEWSYAAQPQGNPDAIVWRYGLDPQEQEDAVRSGRADWMDGIPQRSWRDVRNHDAARLHVNDTPGTDFLVLRTQKPPFDDVRVRRALNLAIDRGRAVRGYGGPEQATPTCQVLPRTDTARLPFCPYTRGSVRSGTWRAPDLRRARRLVAQAPTRGSTVTVLGISDEPPSEATARAAARALRQLGYRADLTIITRGELEGLPLSVRESFDVGPFVWFADFPSPSTFFETMLVCDAPLMHGRICMPALDRRIAAAVASEAHDRGAIDRLWTAVDRIATHRALTVPLVNPRSVELTSARLSGYQYNPQWGFLPALASVVRTPPALAAGGE